MTDTTTPLLGLLLMGTGGDNNSWGLNLNDSVITPIENAIAGTTQLAITGGAYALTAADALPAIIILTGALTSNQTITVPSLSKKWTIGNLTTGNFSVLLKTASQVTPIQVPQGTATDVLVDISTNVVRRLDRRFVGNFFLHAGASAPAGALACNGALPLIASFPDLAAELGQTWGGNGTTTFGLPNGYDTGRFLRSSTATVAVGSYQSSQNKSHTHTGSGTSGMESASHTHSGSGTTGGMNANNPHSHTTPYAAQFASVGSSGLSDAWVGGVVTTPTGTTNIEHGHSFSFTTSTAGATHTHAFSFTTSAGSSDGAEARPESLTGLLCVRY